MEIDRVWEMPNSRTFKVNAIKDFICSNIHGDNLTIIDPFANEHSIKDSLLNHNYISNDLDKEFECDYNLDALDFLKTFEDNSVDVVLFDPPYSGRQVAECYKKLDKTVTYLDTSGNFWARFKIEIARILKPNGLCFSFGWNSNGIGKKNDFIIEKIRLVAHGGNHNDTFCLMERKKIDLLQELFNND